MSDIEQKAAPVNNPYGMGGYDSQGQYSPWINQNSQPQPLQEYRQNNPHQQQNTTYQQIGGRTNRSFTFTLPLKSFSSVNIIAIWVIFLATLAISKLSDNSFSCILFDFGAQYQPSVVHRYQLYRYITPLFLHNGFMHILSNTLGLVMYGYRLEKHYGIVKFIGFYFICGILGNLYSGFNDPQILSVGASSALFGFFPLAVVYIYSIKDVPSRLKKQQVLQILIILILNFLSTSPANIQGQQSSQKIDVAAHIGGFVGGVFFSIIYSDFEIQHWQKIKIAACVLLPIILSFFIIYNQLNENVLSPKGMEDYCQWK